MTALLTGLASLLVFSSVILVHELGHFMAARHCGIHVEEFSIGFGPCLWSTTRDGTTYSVRLLPLGGYNLFSPLPDEEDGEEDESGESAPPPCATAMLLMWAYRLSYRWPSSAVPWLTCTQFP